MTDADMTIEKIAPRPWAPALPALYTIALVAELAIAIALAATLNISQDEAYAMHTTAGSVGHAYQQAIVFEQNAPLYFVVMNLWRHLNDSLFFARAFSIAAIVGTLAVLPGVVRRYLPGVDAGLVTLVVALNPFTVAVAVEVRVYALAVLLSALLLTTFHSAFLEDRAGPRWKMRAAYAAVALAAVYSQYYFAFLLAAQGIVLLAYARKTFGAYVATVAAIAVGMAPLALILPAQVHGFHGGLSAPHSLFASLLANVELAAQYVLPMPAIPHAAFATYGVAAALCAGAAYVARRFFSRDGSTAIAVTTVTAIVLMSAAIFVEHVSVLDDRGHAYFPDLAPLFLAAVVSVFVPLTYVREPARRRLAAAWAALTIALSCIVLAQTYAPRANPGDWNRVARYLEANEVPGQSIAVFMAPSAMPLQYYYRGNNRVVPLPQPVDFGSYDPQRQFAIRDSAQIAAVFPRGDRVWLVSAPVCGGPGPSIALGCRILRNYVERHYRVVSIAPFYRSTVELLRRK